MPLSRQVSRTFETVLFAAYMAILVWAPLPFASNRIWGGALLASLVGLVLCGWLLLYLFGRADINRDVWRRALLPVPAPVPVAPVATSGSRTIAPAGHATARAGGGRRPSRGHSARLSDSCWLPVASRSLSSIALRPSCCACCGARFAPARAFAPQAFASAACRVAASPLVAC